MLTGAPRVQAEAPLEPFNLTILDQHSGKPIPSRVHLKNAQGAPIQAGDLPFWRDHFVCPGAVSMNLTNGQYHYEIERGPEYFLEKGSFTIGGSNGHHLRVILRRYADMASEGWWSGDLHVHRPLKDIELLMQAEDLHVAPVITWWNNRNQWADRAAPADRVARFDRNRFYEVMAGEDERQGGALLFFHLKGPLPIAGAGREFPSPLQFVALARKEPGAWIEIEKPFWWDAPVWLASSQIDSIELANNHMCRTNMLDNEAWGRPRDKARFPEPRGNGFWTQEIYYHILNCGFRLPPTAGSASGVLPNPVGYNRVYVHTGKSLTYGKWWQALREGRTFVSNGLLLRCRADGKWPGHIFKSDRPMTIELEAALDARDPVSALEIIKNGKVQQSIAVKGKASGKIGKVHFEQSGWVLVRAIADNEQTFRFASTAPFYVEVGPAKRRVSRASVQFFLAWVLERMTRIQLDDPVQKAAVFEYHEQAQKFWRELLANANAE